MAFDIFRGGMTFLVAESGWETQEPALKGLHTFRGYPVTRRQVQGSTLCQLHMDW